jgi:para-nitrobenzyl esterase
MITPNRVTCVRTDRARCATLAWLTFQLALGALACVDGSTQAARSSGAAQPGGAGGPPVTTKFLAAVSGAAATVTTPSGMFPAATYQGVAGSDVNVFRGIRYAAAPVGSRRWAPPIAPAASAGPIDATAFGSACPQLASPFGVESSDEDCLFLNVFVPAGATQRDRLPVMVFYYGGAFVSGDSSLYDARQLAFEGKTIVVTVNYRLGLLGYMASPALTRTGSYGVSGNYGLFDQQFALQWVHQNIAAFGGDANDVTIFGESAGGFSTCALLVSPAGTGLFQRMITESAPCAFPLPTLATSEAVGTAFTQKVNCVKDDDYATVACLRQLPVQDVLNGQPSAAELLSTPATLTEFFPNVDGQIVPQQPQTALLLGQYNKVPVIEGTNSDEGSLFIALAFDLLNNAPLTAAEYPAKIQASADAVLQQLSGAGTPSSTSRELLAREISDQYPLSDYTSPDQALATVVGDETFSCPALISDQLLSLNVPTFAYEFADRSAPMLLLKPVSFPYGATHADELQFLFPRDAESAQLSADEQRLASTMRDYWSQFARAANPNALLPRQPLWLGFSTVTPNIESLTAPTPGATNDFAQRHHCNFWQSVLVQGAVLSALPSPAR